MACILAAILIGSSVFLSRLRISGYMSNGSISVAEINGNQVTIHFSSRDMIDRIGRDKITVPYYAFGKPLEAGETIEHGWQLAIELTNNDLRRLGFNPLQRFQTGSAEKQDEWMRLILHLLFENDPEENAVLWVREISGLKPLF